MEVVKLLNCIVYSHSSLKAVAGYTEDMDDVHDFALPELANEVPNLLGRESPLKVCHYSTYNQI